MTLGDALVLYRDTGELPSAQREGQTVDCSFFKSVGTSVQDITTAAFVYRKAQELNVGVEIPV